MNWKKDGTDWKFNENGIDYRWSNRILYVFNSKAFEWEKLDRYETFKEAMHAVEIHSKGEMNK